MFRKLTIVTIIFMLIIPSFPLVSLPEEVEGVFNSFSPSASDELQGGTGSSEEDNIDSFDVHPINRWTVQDSDADIDVAEIDDGLLNISDNGDGTDDRYAISRSLRDLDGKIEIRFKVDSNSSNTQVKDAFYIQVGVGSYASAIRNYMSMTDLKNNSYSTTMLNFYTPSGDVVSLNLAGDERIFDNVWYRLKIDYDTLQSGFRWRCYFDNGSKVFDYHYFEISELARPVIFEQTTLDISIWTRSFTAGNNKICQIDYINAPFKEREWTQYSTTADNDWLDYSPTVARCQGSVTDDIAYRLTVPYLDYFSGDWIMEWDNTSAINNGDNFGLEVRLYGVDADDGDLHYILGFEANTGRYGASLWNNFLYLQNGTHNTYYSSSGYATGAELPNCGGTFGFSMTDNRDKVSLKVHFLKDISNNSNFANLVEQELLSDWVTVNSDEFVIEIEYDPDITAVGQSIIVTLDNLDVIERNIFDAVGDFIGGVISTAQDVVGGGTDIFTILFRWLGGMLSAAFAAVGEALGVIFVAVGAAIIVALSPIATSLSTLAADIWSGIGNALDFLTTAIGLVTTAVEAIASDVATAVWEGIGTALDFITTAITGIAAAIWVAVLAVASDLADLVVDIIDFLIALAGNILSAIIDFITQLFFYFWDAIGLPDVLAVVDLFLVAFVEIITNFPAFIQQVAPRIIALVSLGAILGVIYFLIFPAISSDSVGEFIEKFFDHFFKDLTGGSSIGGFGFPVPIGLLWMLTVITTILSSTIFGGFFT